MTLLIFTSLLLFLLTVVSSKSIPSYLHICHSSDPKLEECVLQAVEDLRDEMKKGIPELEMPSIEPLIMDEPISTQGAGITVTTKDLKAYGGGNFTIKKLDIDLKNHKYKFFVAFDHLAIQGLYEVDGKIIMIPIKGNGDMMCDVYDVDAVVDVKSKSVDVNGVEELRFTDMNVDINVGSGKVKLNNLFNGDKLIGEVINAAINLNFQYFIKELKPIISETLSRFVLKSANNICEGLPYHDLLPE